MRSLMLPSKALPPWPRCLRLRVRLASMTLCRIALQAADVMSLGFLEHAKSSDERYKKMREFYEKLKNEHVGLLRNVSRRLEL